MPGSNEKRKYDRLAVADFHLNATLAIISGSRTTAHLCVVKDVSKRGLGVYLKAPIAEGTSFRISVEGFPHIPLPGTVSWCKPIDGDPTAPASHPFLAGLELVPEDDETRESQLSLFAQMEAFMKRRTGQ